MNQRALALLAATIASAIYGANHTIAKDLMPDVIGPFGFIVLRVLGAAVLFWIVSLFVPNERVARKDWLRILACSFFGMVLNMNMFFKGLELSTPINSSVVITLTPVLLLVLSAVFLKEKITWMKSVGIGLGLVGALLLILFGIKTQPNAPNIPLGNILFIFNATSYAIYLIIVKPLVHKYSSITLMKFFFLFSIFINVPVGGGEFMEVAWLDLDWSLIWKLGFVVVGTTFFTYLLNIYALKQLKPSTIGAFIYLQPVLAAFFAILAGADKLTPLRIGAALLIFLGVFLSTRTPKRLIKKSKS
ncbi:MAG: DMT family transporter [Flavobacteriaceae bacterium]|nr:DMT family transporter [Flavobacteriaceae bacterium]